MLVFRSSHEAAALTAAAPSAPRPSAPAVAAMPIPPRAPANDPAMFPAMPNWDVMPIVSDCPKSWPIFAKFPFSLFNCEVKPPSTLFGTSTFGERVGALRAFRLDCRLFSFASISEKFAVPVISNADI